jgi:hypothetical protein
MSEHIGPHTGLDHDIHKPQVAKSENLKEISKQMENNENSETKESEENQNQNKQVKEKENGENDTVRGIICT